MKRLAIWFTFSAGADVSERDAVLRSFVALGDHLGHVSAFACGPDADAGARTAGFGHAFVVDFETESARAAYRALPAYAAATARLILATEGGLDGVRVCAPDQACP